MYCTNCGEKVPEGATYCPGCGERLDKSSSAAVGFDDPKLIKHGGAQVPPERRNESVVVAAGIIAFLAVVAVVALLVVLNPFGLGSSTESPVPEPPAQQVVEGEEDSKEDSSQDTEDEKDAESETVDSVSADDEDADKDADKDADQESDGDKAVDDADDVDEDPDQSESDGTYVLPDSATHAYSERELADYTNWELYVARNEVYARHGRRFRNEDLQGYFDRQPWYEPELSPDEFDARADSLLNSIERKNVDTILSVETSRGSEYL